MLQLVVPFQTPTLILQNHSRSVLNTFLEGHRMTNSYEKLYVVGAFREHYINTLEKIHSQCTKRAKVNCLLHFFVSL